MNAHGNTIQAHAPYGGWVCQNVYVPSLQVHGVVVDHHRGRFLIETRDEDGVDEISMPDDTELEIDA